MSNIEKINNKKTESMTLGSVSHKTLSSSNFSTINSSKKAVDEVMNLGYTYFGNSKDIFKAPIDVMNKAKIFDYENINISQHTFGDLVYSKSLYRFHSKKNFVYMDKKALKTINSQAVLGNFPISNESYVHNVYAKYFKEKPNLNAQIHSDTYEILELSHNHSLKFPNLDKDFAKEAMKVFYEFPIKENMSEHISYRLLSENQQVYKKIVGFFQKYGTHYVNKAYYGFTAGKRSENNTGKDNDAEKLAESNNTKEYQLGICLKDKHGNLDTKSCILKDPKLVKIEVKPICDLFAKVMSGGTIDIVDSNAKSLNLSKKVVSKINHLMEMSLEMLQQATEISQLAVISVMVAQNQPEECKKNNGLIKEYMTNYDNYDRKKDLMRALRIRDKEIPVVRIKNWGIVTTMDANGKKDYRILSDTKPNQKSLYMCVIKSFLLAANKDILDRQNFYTDVKLIGKNDRKMYEEAGYKCDTHDKHMWKYRDPHFKTQEKIETFGYCYSRTKNTFDSNIILDIKFFEFSEHLYKCSDKKLEVFMDNYYYTCDCDTDYNLLSEDPKDLKLSRFMCVSRVRQNLMEMPEAINKPKVTYRRVRVESVEEELEHINEPKTPDVDNDKPEDDMNFV
jgi:hypothetical protein